MVMVDLFQRQYKETVLVYIFKTIEIYLHNPRTDRPLYVSHFLVADFMYFDSSRWLQNFKFLFWTRFEKARQEGSSVLLQLLPHDIHFFQHSYHKETCENTNGRNGIFQWFEETHQCPGGNLLEKVTKWQQWLLLWDLSLAIHGNAISCFLPLRHLLNKNYHLVFKGGFYSDLPNPQPVLVHVPIL